MTLSLKFTAITDRGLVRQNNEDSAHAGPHLLLLADGMGGHAAGEVASQLMVEHLEHLDQDPEDNDMLALLGAAAEDANASISAHVEQHPETEGMGTTLTAMMFNGTEFGVCHVGDSRGYRLRDGKLTQVTRDDTYVQSLVDEGRLDPEDVSSHPQKSLILKAYTGRPVDPTLFMLDAKVGDRLLLCSDGLSDPVTATTIELALSQSTLDDAAVTLRDLALRSGGPDNVTIVLAEVVEGKGDSSPVKVGAIAGVVPEPTHPDSSASRAAALTRPREASPAPQEEEDDTEEPHSPKKKVGWKVIGALVVVLALVIGGGFWTKNEISNNFYVATDEEGALSIEQGVDFSVFGRSLHHKYQNACVDKANTLRLGSTPCEGDFAPFKVTDLPDSERAAVDNLPSGSYAEVQTQLSSLSSKALKPCISTPSKKTDEKLEKKTAKPGITCRKVS